MIQICFATNNKNKIHEVWPLIPPDFRILNLQDIKCFEDLPETKDTLEDNALQKAEYVYNKYGVACFADDSGLEVYALHGAPGVYSARYAGTQRNSDDNIDLLLKNLQNKVDRKARFRAIFALVGMGPTKLFEGIVEGEILHERKGSLGFGYDSIFQPSGHNKSFAELSIQEKNQFSHRAQATRKLISYLKSYGKS